MKVLDSKAVRIHPNVIACKKYRLDSVLQEGGFATVYNVQGDDTVVIKSEWINVRGEDQFLREIKTQNEAA